MVGHLRCIGVERHEIAAGTSILDAFSIPLVGRATGCRAVRVHGAIGARFGLSRVCDIPSEVLVEDNLLEKLG